MKVLIIILTSFLFINAECEGERAFNNKEYVRELSIGDTLTVLGELKEANGKTKKFFYRYGTYNYSGAYITTNKDNVVLSIYVKK